MNDELIESYDLLGLGPGASPEELKVAYRDLAKVWHPDRFLHDPRLQEKAQEKLKEINEAYEQLRSGKAKWQTRPAAPRTSPTPGPFDQDARGPQTGDVAVVQRIRWQLILAPVLIFAVVFWATYSSLIRPGDQEDRRQVSAIEQPDAPPDPEQQRVGSRDSSPMNELPRTDQVKVSSQSEDPDSASASQPSAAPVRRTPTVTVDIDPYTGMIARPDCPVKSTMTYSSGNEPQQRCNALHPVPKDSRIKSVAKRLASPGKWLGGAKSDPENKQDSKLP